MNPRIAVLDIERIPLQFAGDAWSLDDMKGRRISPDMVTRWARTICFAYRWHGEKRIRFEAEWKEGGYEGMLRAAHAVYDEADVVVGHNLQNFDTKKLQGGWIDLGMAPPSPWKTFDTLLVARKHFGFEANHLDVLCKRFGIRAKTDKYNVEMAEAAVAGDVKSQRRIEQYNRGDIDATTDLFDYLRPWGSINFAVFADDEERRCPSCLSTNVIRRGMLTKLKGAYPRWSCNDCGKWSSGGRAVKMVELA